MGLVTLDLVAALLIFRMRIPKSAVVVGRDAVFLQGIMSGMGHSFSNKFVLGVLSISLVMNAMVLPLQYFIPVIATDVLKVDRRWEGCWSRRKELGRSLGH